MLTNVFMEMLCEEHSLQATKNPPVFTSEKTEAAEMTQRDGNVWRNKFTVRGLIVVTSLLQVCFLVLFLFMLFSFKAGFGSSSFCNFRCPLTWLLLLHPFLFPLVELLCYFWKPWSTLSPEGLCFCFVHSLELTKSLIFFQVFAYFLCESAACPLHFLICALPFLTTSCPF